VEQEQLVQKQGGYGPALCVLGLIDAALGNKEAAPKAAATVAFGANAALVPTVNLLFSFRFERL
jgi:hypothetical protein